jgi:hypothetical protein
MSVDLILTDRFGTRLTALPHASLEECIWELNKPGSVNVEINPLRKEAELIELNKTEIQVWIDGVYRHCVVPRDCSGSAKKIQFQCEGILGYLATRHINDSLTYGDPGQTADPTADPPLPYIPPTYVEQLQIGWNLISYAQTGANKDFRIDSAPWAPSGHGRLRRWNWWEHKEILNELQSFNEVDDGFDFDIVLFGDGHREWTPYYPSKGTHRYNLVLEWGRNVVDFSFQEEGKNQGTFTYCTGGSANNVHFEQHYEDAALSAEYGVQEKIISNGSELDVNELLDEAREDVRTYGRPIQVPDLTVKDIPAKNGMPAIKLDGVLATGDIVPVRINHGRCKMNGDYRIVKINRKKQGQLVLSLNVWSGV